jgi:hypothetical protein
MNTLTGLVAEAARTAAGQEGEDSFDAVVVQLCESFAHYREQLLKLKGKLPDIPMHRPIRGAGFTIHTPRLANLVDALVTRHFSELVEVLAAHASIYFAPPGGETAYIDHRRCKPWPDWRPELCDLHPVWQKMLRLYGGGKAARSVCEQIASFLKFREEEALHLSFPNANCQLAQECALQNEPSVEAAELTDLHGYHLQGLLNHLNVVVRWAGHPGVILDARQLWQALQRDDSCVLAPGLIQCHRYGANLGFELSATLAAQLHQFFETYDHRRRR